MRKISKEYPVIAWWSGGIASAVTCHLCIEWFGADNVRVIFIETNNEDDDTYRFKSECEVWYGKEIESITNPNYKNIQEVWYKHLSLNVAGGAVCSSQLKREARIAFERDNNYSFQAFGFDIEEVKRAKGLKINNPKAKPIFPLISELMTKDDCVSYIKANNTLFHPLRFPRAYMVGYRNNNCFQTGCVQGGIGYWQKIAKEYPDKLNAMAKIEHDLTEVKGKPTTVLKNSRGLVFLKRNPNYPEIPELSEVEGKEVLPLVECNGFCGMEDIEPNPTLRELNFE